ncbi:hypothetical protein QLX08_004773 [Tetragonisca angustula]|uniref:Uncharacterized protein n=1 Tax=Tetragonisca angustula TaxID=166442 RepID=A0AAW1A3A5_9HYME
MWIGKQRQASFDSALFHGLASATHPTTSINLSSIALTTRGRKSRNAPRRHSGIVHYLISPIGINDGSLAAGESSTGGGADKIFSARHQPPAGKLDSSGVGKPPLLLRHRGKVIRE